MQMAPSLQLQVIGTVYSYMPSAPPLLLHVIDIISTNTCHWDRLYSYMSLEQSLQLQIVATVSTFTYHDSI